MALSSLQNAFTKRISRFGIDRNETYRPISNCDVSQEHLSLIGGDVNFSTVPAAALNAALRGAPLRVIYSTFYRPMHLALYQTRDP
jgi:hypothetical protein